MRRRDYALVIFVTLFMAGILIPSALPCCVAGSAGRGIAPSGADEDNDGIDDELEKMNERSLDVQVSNESVSIQSESRQGQQKDKYEVTIQKDEGHLSFSLTYHSDSNLLASEISIKLVLERIIEYNDTNGNGIYDAASDSIVQAVDLVTFGSFTHDQMVFEGNVSVHHLVIRAAADMFIVDIWIGDGFFTVNNTIVTPAQLKLGITLDAFPFLNATSQLAIEVSMEYNEEVQENSETEDELLGLDTNETSIETKKTASNVGGYFSWSEQATVDSITRSVNASTVLHGSEPNHLVYLTYPRGALIIHDPKVGFSGIIKRPGVFDPTFIIIIIICIAIIAIFGLTMTREEYRNYLLTRTVFVNKGAHRLSMEDVLDNERRNKILDLLIAQPGIHFKELMRQTDIGASNLAWHLDVLETYKIIHKQRVGHFLIYYPYLDKNPFAAIDPKIAKSKTTLEIFQLVADNPGMYQNEIARRMGLDHKTVWYHLDKLVTAVLISSRKDGRRTRFYPVDMPKENNEGNAAQHEA
jgi:predicted transcriptional regulator